MTSSRIVTVLGAEGAGKSTLCAELTRCIGAQTVIVPEWPSFDDFLKAPARHAFDNQTQAISGCLASYEEACSLRNVNTILLEMGPERVHLIYSTLMKEFGYFTFEQWSILQGQYESARSRWTRNYIYLHAEDEIIRSRLKDRNRKEDLAWNQQQANNLAERWRALINSDWRKDKNLLVLPSDRGVGTMVEAALRWLESL